MSNKAENIPGHEGSRVRSSSIERYQDRRAFFEEILRPCVAEVIAMSLLVVLGTLPILGMSLVQVAVANGFGFAVAIITFRAISGCHINPVITLAVLLCGHINFFKALCYFVSQLLGSLIGSLIVRALIDESIYDDIKGGVQNPGPGVTVWQAILCEITLTFMLIFVVLAVKVKASRHDDVLGVDVLGPVYVGITVTVALLIGFQVSGPSMNPLRSFGPAVIASSLHVGSGVWEDHWVYWVGPTVGALLATACFRVFLFPPEHRWFKKSS